MREWTFSAQRSARVCNIFCGEGAREEPLARAVAPYRKRFVFTDANVHRLYGNWIRAAFPETTVVAMPAGEEYKTPETLLSLLRAMAQAELHRGDCLIAVGGGVAGDIGGLAAALYMRGIACIQVPTTLLAQVDSSVGGKTAVDLGGVKNLVGAFWQPNAVIADPVFLSTLPPREIRCGLGEMIKHAALHAPLFAQVSEGEDRLNDLGFLAPLVEENIAFKLSVVREDPEEKGIRKSLNLGHTTAHALELSLKTLSHGECVLLGIVLEGELAQERLDCDKEYLRRLRTICAAALGGFPALPPLREALRLARLDKKNIGEEVTVTAPIGMGRYAVFSLPWEEYARGIERAGRKIC